MHPAQPVTDCIRQLVEAKLTTEASVLERLPAQYQTHIRVWWRDGAPSAVTLEHVEAQPERWKK